MTRAAPISKRRGGSTGAFSIWLQAIRVHTLTVFGGAVVVGGAAAYHAGFFSLERFLLALAGSLAIQAGTNLNNDYYDYVSGADTRDPEAPDAFGPGMVIQRGLLSAEQVWRGGIAAFAVGSAIGLVLVYICGWPILILGIASVAAGYFYTARPVAFAYLAMGDVVALLFLGPAIVMGTYYVLAGSVSAGAFAVSLSAGFLGSGVLVVNNLRDIERDRRTGKRTLATYLGRRWTIIELALFDAAAFGSVLAGVLTRALPGVCLMVFLALSRAVDELRIAGGTTDPRELGAAMKRAAQLHMEFCLLAAVAFVIAAIRGW